MSQCINCKAEMHPLDAQRWLNCNRCRGSERPIVTIHTNLSSEYLDRRNFDAQKWGFDATEEYDEDANYASNEACVSGPSRPPVRDVRVKYRY